MNLMEKIIALSDISSKDKNNIPEQLLQHYCETCGQSLPEKKAFEGWECTNTSIFLY